MKNKEIEQQKMKSSAELKEYAKENGFKVPEILNYKFVAVGYLAFGEPFEKGEVSTSFLAKLKLLWSEGGVFV